MPAVKTKCLNCGNDYVAFIYESPALGNSYENYPCPRCGSVKKNKKIVERKKEDEHNQQ